MNAQAGLFQDKSHQPTKERALACSLLQHVLHLPRLIFEPCAGQGSISDVLRKSDRTVFESDIVWVDSNGIERTSFTGDATVPVNWQRWADTMSKIPSIDCRNWASVTNPPLSIAAEILPLAYEYSPWGVAFLLRSSCLEATNNRVEWLQRYADNLRYVIPVGQSLKFRHDNNFQESVTVAWYVWQKSWSWNAVGIKCPFIFENSWEGL